MKITIEIWQNEFNDEWNCCITDTTDQGHNKKSCAIENFCDLLKLVSDKIPNAKCKGKPIK